MNGYRMASAGLGRVPPRLSLPVARAAFVGSYYAWPAKRSIILHNAAQVLGRSPSDPEVARLARQIYATYSRFVVELMRMPGRPDDEPSRLMRDAGERSGDSFVALYEQLRSQGRGTIVVSGHIGSIDILAGAFAARGLPTYGVADDSAYPELFELMNRQRRRWGITVVPWRNLREIYRALRSRGIVGLVVDWGYRSGDVPVKLFGAWTTLPAGPALLAARTGSAVVPVVCRRNSDGTFVAHHDDPMDVPDTAPASILRATQAIADALERMIAAAPDQWYSFKPIWPRTRAEQDLLRERAAEMAAAQAAARPRSSSPSEAHGPS